MSQRGVAQPRGHLGPLPETRAQGRCQSPLRFLPSQPARRSFHRGLLLGVCWLVPSVPPHLVGVLLHELIAIRGYVARMNMRSRREEYVVKFSRPPALSTS